MHRHLSRYARRSLQDSYNTLNQPQRVKRNVLERVQLPQAFSSSNDYYRSVSGYHSRTKYAQLQIVGALRLGERERASKMLLNLGNMNVTLNVADFSYILDYCAQTPDPMFVTETWKIMEEKAIEINQRCWIFIIQAFSKGGYLMEAFNWLKFLGENGSVQGILPMYNIFLRECGKKQNLTNAEKCLELMDRQLTGKSEITYWELLKLAVFQKNLSAVHHLWKDYTRYYSPSIITLRKFTWSFTRLRDLESAYNTLQHMVDLASQRNLSLRTLSTGKYGSSLLDIPMPLIIELPDEDFGLKNREWSNNSSCEGYLGDINEGSVGRSTNIRSRGKQSLCNIDGNPKLCGIMPIPSHVPNIPDSVSNGSGICYEVENDNIKQDPGCNIVRNPTTKPVMSILRWSFNDIIHACARFKQCELAENLFMQMHDLGLEPSQHTYDGFAKAVICGKGVSYGMKVIELMEKRNVKPYNDTLAALSMGHSKQLELDQSEAFLDKISSSLPRYIHPFNSFLAACDFMGEPERAVSILVKLKHSNIKLNIRTYELLLSLFGNVNVPYEKGNILSHADVMKRITIIETDMMKNGVQHSYTSMKNLIRSLGAEGMIQEMLAYLNVAENMLLNKNSYQSDMYDIVLHALVKAKDCHRAIEVFKNVRLLCCPTSIATYNIMIECCSQLKCYRSACALVSMMLRHGFNPEILTYTELIKVLVSTGDFAGAIGLVDQSISEGIQPDIQLFNTILREASLEGRIDIIEHVIGRIHRMKIQPDPSTCHYTFTAYVECGFHTTALESLQVLSLWMISKDDFVLQEQKAALEDLILDEDLDAFLKIVEDLIGDSREFFATGVLNLRCCAIADHPISWSPDESPWAQRISSC